MTVYIQYYFGLVSGLQSTGVRQWHTLQSGPPDISSMRLASQSYYNIIGDVSDAVILIPMTILQPTACASQSLHAPHPAPPPPLRWQPPV